MGTCPECDENIEIDEDAEVGDCLDCPRCQTRLEILDLNPVLLDYAEADDEIS